MTNRARTTTDQAGGDRPAPSRRNLVCGLAAAGLAGPLLAACGGEEEASGPTGSSGDVLVATSDVEVGGGTLVSDQGVYVTQPSAGTFEAFSAVCTHQKCTVDAGLKDGKIHCSCHGSEFSIADGSVQAGPAEKPLARVEVKVEGGNVVLA